MTFKDLLENVKFDDVAPHIVNMYPDTKKNLGWYKIHFDMLRQMTPVCHEDANDKRCRITLVDWQDGTGLHLDAYPMEGDLWEHSLTKELIISPDVHVSNEELAACCLWHTSFYGFVEKHGNDAFRTESFGLDIMDRWDDNIYYKTWSNYNYAIIRRYGGLIPKLRDLSRSKKYELIKKAKDSFLCRKGNRHKRKKQFRNEIMACYYERMSRISDFIVKNIPVLYNGKNRLTTMQLCGLFNSDTFYSEEIMSYANDGENGAEYLLDVISKYDMFPKSDGIIVRMTIGAENEILTEEEQSLYDYLAKGKKYSDLIIDVMPSLGCQVVISYAAYNSTMPLLL